MVNGFISGDPYPYKQKNQAQKIKRNNVACMFLSNISYEDQYTDVQRVHPDKYDAWVSRILPLEVNELVCWCVSDVFGYNLN